jgi:hypothetical protein
MKKRYGIKMKAYCREHEALVRDRLATGAALEELLRLHALKIRWLQHERLVHLIVLVLIAVLFLFTIGLFVALGDLFILALIAVILVLLCFYICHYFFLENTVQRWYALYDEICGKSEK